MMFFVARFFLSRSRLQATSSKTDSRVPCSADEHTLLLGSSCISKESLIDSTRRREVSKNLSVETFR